MDVWAVYSAASKFALYLGSLGTFGLALNAMLFRSTIKWRSIRSWVAGFVILGVLGSVANFLLRGASLTGEWSGAIDPEILSILWETPVGTAVLYRLIGFGIALAAMLAGKSGSVVAIIGGICVLWSFTQIGHVAEDDTLVAGLVLLLHVAIASFWIGILIPLHALAADPDTQIEAGDLGHDFGMFAIWFIPILLLAGTYLSWQLVGGVGGLFTPYGLTLVLKLVGVAVLLGLGALNKTRFVPRLKTVGSSAGIHLANAINAEWCVVFLILAVTALLTSVFSPVV